MLGSSGLVGWLGEGLAQLLANISLGWLASAVAGIGKALILFVWIISAILYALFFAMTGQIGRAMQNGIPMAAQQTPASPTKTDSATVTLERAPDGSYR